MKMNQLLLIVAVLAYGLCASARERTSSPLGIGFLWTEQSRPVVDKLKSDKDFVDLILGPGKLDVFQKVHPPLRVACIARRLQPDEATRKPVPVSLYREKVKRIVDALRQGNPDIRIFVQLVTTAERGSTELNAEQIAAFARSIDDLVEAIRIYGAPGDRLNAVIDQLRGPVPTSNP